MYKVIVINPGCVYLAYETMVEEYNLKNWKKGETVKKGEIVKVIDVVPHLIRNHPVAIVEKESGRQILIDERGIESRFKSLIKNKYKV